MKKLLIALLLTALCLAAAACGDKEAAYQTVAPEAALELIEQEDALVIIDVRAATEYNAAHIENAFIVPLGTIGEEPPAQLTDKTAPVLVYGATPEDGDEAAAKLAAMGFERIYALEGGVDNWTYEMVPTLSWCPTC